MDFTLLMLSLVFGMLGMGMFMYGKRAGRPVPLLAGGALMAVPYFIPNAGALLIICGFITAIPWAMRNT